MEKVHQIIDAVVAIVPEYLANPEDRNISGGNWAICFNRGNYDYNSLE
jgi:hypothetical protein